MALTHSHGDDGSSSHSHNHGHDHVPKVMDDSERRIFRVMCLTGGFMIIQAIGGLVSGSFALIADSGYMLR